MQVSKPTEYNQDGTHLGNVLCLTGLVWADTYRADFKWHRDTRKCLDYCVQHYHVYKYLYGADECGYAFQEKLQPKALILKGGIGKKNWPQGQKVRVCDV